MERGIYYSKTAIFRGKMIFQNTVPPQRWVMEDRQQTPHGFLATIGSPLRFGTNPHVFYPCLNGLYNMIYIYIYTRTYTHHTQSICSYHMSLYLIMLHNYTIITIVWWWKISLLGKEMRHLPTTKGIWRLIIAVAFTSVEVVANSPRFSQPYHLGPRSFPDISFREQKYQSHSCPIVFLSMFFPIKNPIVSTCFNRHV